jgi:NitT/TauT family transport system substrate-binding protein
MPVRSATRWALVVLATLTVLVVGVAPVTAGAAPKQNASTIRLGYFPNVTHATAIVGVESGVFQEKLGRTQLDTSTFSAGPQVVEALNSGALDASYIGPNPAINAFAQSGGEAIRIISGATSGGAFLVVKPDTKNAKDLKGKKVASPQLGNTQDVALRTWLKKKGLKTDTAGGGDVSIVPQENAQTLDLFKQGQIDGAWVPEPWATRMIDEGGGHILVDERALWPGGKYVTTHLIVRTDFLAQHPDVVKRLLAAHVEATDFVNDSPAEAQGSVVAAIGQITGSPISVDTLSAAWGNLIFTVDPIASSLQASAEDAAALGFLESADLAGIYDLGPLNEILREAGKPEVTAQ